LTTLNQALRNRELARRNGGGDLLKIAKLLASLSPEQRRFVEHKHRFKVAVCPRRAGKSQSLCVYMLVEALAAKSTPILFLSLTRESAKAAVWGTLLELLDKFNIQHESRPSTLQIRFPNGSLITLVGGDVPGARHKLRGRKFKLVCIDEAGFVSNSNFDQLIYSLLPALADLRGTLAMASSPGETMDGFFYHAYAGDMKDSWVQFDWDMLANPYFMTPATSDKYKTKGEEELATICNLQFGGNWSHPTFLREYRGKYVQDNEKLVYPFTSVNVIQTVPTLDDEQFGIGIDFGVTSESAIVVGKFSQYSKDFIIIDSWSRAKCSVDELAAEIMSRQEKYNPIMTVADTGGLGAATTQELRRRYQIPINAADKRDKVFYQRTMAADLYSGYIKVLEGLELLNEWTKIVRGPDGEELKGVKNHEADAALYLWRYAHTAYLKHAEPRLTDDQIMLNQLIQQAIQESKEAEDDLY